MKFTTQSLLGMTPELEAALRGRGIVDSEELLYAARTPAGRNKLARAMKMSAQAILEMAGRADVARIKGIGMAYAELLERAGIDRVQKLARWEPDALRRRLAEVNLDLAITGRIPSLAQIADWIAQARKLPKILD